MDMGEKNSPPQKKQPVDFSGFRIAFVGDSVTQLAPRKTPAEGLDVDQSVSWEGRKTHLIVILVLP